MLDMDQPVGKIPGEYQIERLLGRSELGAAYLAQQPSQGRRVMITTFNLPPEISAWEYEELNLRLTREGEILTRLVHPHILPVYAFGVQSSNSYLVTAFIKDASLGQLLRENVRFSPQQLLPMLKQLAAGLDYAHDQGIVHGTLSLSNVIVSNELNVRIAGFGLRTMLDLQGNKQNTHPLAHLFSSQGMFLGTPEYISPERVLGQTIDSRADVYALGIMLFELLSGKQPFSGAQPQDIALQRLQQPIPSLHAVCPDILEAFDLVIGKMLELDPAKRTQRAGDIPMAFERILKTLETTQSQGAGNFSANGSMKNAQITLPPTVNWFDEQIILSDQQQGAVLPASEPTSIGMPSTGKEKALFSANAAPASPAENNPASLGGMDPFTWWSTTSSGLPAQSPQPRTPGTFGKRSPLHSTASKGHARSRPDQRGRRKLVTLIVAGSAATVGVLTIGGISFARLTQSMKQSQLANAPISGSTGVSGGSNPTPGTQTTPNSPKSGTLQSTPMQGAHQTPTAQPKPTPPPGHTGTVIGSTGMAPNSSKIFTNPADGQSSLLIRLANGTFVACERACTHEGVPVNYSSSQQQIVCPAHGAIFNPSNGFSHVSGPGSGPLPTVRIRVNADGTITTG